MRTLIPGEWYLTFVCNGCKSKQVLFPDLSNGTSNIRATYSVACHTCGHKDAYESEAIERYQHLGGHDEGNKKGPHRLTAE
jgi:DNA-directed RNA polymerase subunit RPC12/RpoP